MTKKFFYPDQVVPSPWNKETYGRVIKVFTDPVTETEMVQVAYWGNDLPPQWEIGGKQFPFKYDPTEIIYVCHYTNNF